MRYLDSKIPYDGLFCPIKDYIHKSFNSILESLIGSSGDTGFLTRFFSAFNKGRASAVLEKFLKIKGDIQRCRTV